MCVLGRLNDKEGAYDDGTITFHDACKIQRRGGHIKEPRELLMLWRRIHLGNDPNKEESICCGGGGGVIAIKEADQTRYAAFGLKISRSKKWEPNPFNELLKLPALQVVDRVEHFHLDVKVAG